MFTCQFYLSLYYMAGYEFIRVTGADDYKARGDRMYKITHNNSLSEKFNRIKEILSEFDTFSLDQQIFSLCASLDRLDSL